MYNIVLLGADWELRGDLSVGIDGVKLEYGGIRNAILWGKREIN